MNVRYATDVMSIFFGPGSTSPIIGFNSEMFDVERDKGGCAVFSQGRRYRYFLSREWDLGKPAALFVMLNPSTADAFKLDPTVRRCYDFAKRWGCGSLFVANIFALRSTNPRLLAFDGDPVGEHNDEILRGLINAPGISQRVAAWGVHGYLNNRQQEVKAIFADRQVHCLGTTKLGYPKHPLYVKGETHLSLFAQ